MVVEEITIIGVPATLVTSTEPGTASAIGWTADNNAVFNISGFLTDEDLIAIAGSVQPMKASFAPVADIRMQIPRISMFVLGFVLPAAYPTIEISMPQPIF